MIRIFKLKQVIYVWLVFVLVASVVAVSLPMLSITKVVPDFKHYSPGTVFDTRECSVYNQVPYMGQYGADAGYCSIDSYLMPPISRANLVMEGNVIFSSILFLNGDLKVQDFLDTLGKPDYVLHWRSGYSIRWAHVTINVFHGNGGSVDNVTVRYVYLH